MDTSLRQRRQQVLVGLAVRLLLFVGFYTLFVLTAITAHRRVAAAQCFRLEPALCRVLAKPAWMPASEIEAIRRATGLLDRSLPLYEPGLTERLGEAHAASPWVKRVREVGLFHPNRAVVALELRKPLAGVLMNGRDIVLVDEEGVRLPGLHRRPPKDLGYPLRRIDGVGGAPPAAGVVWSAAVKEGAAVAGELLILPPDLAGALPIVSIDVSAVGRGGPVLLTTTSGAVIEWGRSRSHEFGALGPTLAEKVRKLERTLVVHPSLAGVHRVKLQFPDLVVEQTVRPGGI
ncbi:MAG: hypothetical protein MUE73_04930 [Planctomycetes bacterium]|jgi:hypothetical protein|nr:hypothetical protein [Planctomycetota bacterium]